MELTANQEKMPQEKRRRNEKMEGTADRERPRLLGVGPDGSLWK
jgi:hypothetical protein